MATTIDRIKSMRLYKSPIFYPIGPNNKTKNSVLFILSKNINSTCKFLVNNRFLINNNRFVSYYIERQYNYILKNILSESFTEDLFNNREQTMVEMGLNSDHGVDDPILNDYFIKTKDTVLYYPDAVDKIIFSEEFSIIQNYSNIFKKFLYSERIKNQKQLVNIYKQVKEKVPFIKYTYLNLDLYREKNIIFDWSYYLEAFNKNNYYKLDKGQDLMLHMIQRFVNDKRLESLNYMKKTVIIPVTDWASEPKDVIDYMKKVTPLTMIYRLIKTKNNLSEYFKNIDFLFCNDNAYFKLSFDDFDITDLPRFTMYINKLISNDIEDAEYVAADPTVAGNNDIDTAASVSSNDKEEWVDIVTTDVTSAKSRKINDARIKRMNKLNDDFDKSEVGDTGKTVKDISDSYYTKQEDLTVEPIPIDNINEEWKDVKFPTFNSNYNATDDIVMIFKSFRNKSNPLSIISVTKADTTNHEDYIETYTVKFEDSYGTRSEVKIDMPKLINHRFMKLRGNIKTINGQLVLLPIIKTSEDTAQIVSNYNKIFVRRVSPANGSKITKGVNRLYKTINKVKDDGNISVFEGDNSAIYTKYNLPAEYTAIGGLFAKFVLKDGSGIYFDYEYCLKLAKDKKYDKANLIPVGYDTKKKDCIYARKNNVGNDIAEYLASKDEKFAEVYKGTKASNKLAYSEASILTTRIPIIVVMAYSEGLQTAMNKANIKYRVTEKNETIGPNESKIRFSDGYLIYNAEKPEDSLLMSGLDQTDLSGFSIKDINSKTMWLDVLDDFGGRIKADGLDNFYDCMFDPMTIDACKRYNLPYDYVTALSYASSLLATNEFNPHTDISGNRLRTNELITGYLYKSISKAYGDYANKVKRSGKGTKFTMKQSAVIDNILLDPGCSDLSILNPLLEAEANNTISFKGLSGMNSDRSYNLDKRLYDKSMLGVLGMSTGFASTIGITRQATINSSIKDERGKIESKSEDELNTLNGLTIYEGLAPYGSTHDDPIRTAMGYIQTVKHQMRVKHSSPNLITYGMDEALPYFTTDIFSYKFKGKKGKVLDVTDEYIVFEEIDKNGKKSNHMVSLKETVLKNSDGGFYITVKRVPMVKKGETLKYNDILAYDPTAYSKANAINKNQKNIAYNIGTMAKVAIMCTDEAYEDSSIIDNRLSEALTTEYCVKKDRSLPAYTNVYSIIKKGTKVEEGTSLMVFENSFNEDEANKLLQNIADDELELITDFGRIQLRSKISGVVQDIKIYRTCDIDDLSPSLKKIVTVYENDIKKTKAMAKKYNISEDEVNYSLEPDYKLPQTGKLKVTENGVLIEFYIKTEDKMGIGDKLTYNTAIKGVIKDIMPEGDEPYTDFRPNEKIDALLTSASVNARMVASIINGGALNKTLIELTRKCKDILGIKWNYL